MGSNCQAGDNVFGPIVRGCRDDFDFTLVFEQSILSIGPSVLLLFLAPWRLLHLIRCEIKILPHPIRGTKAAVAAVLVGLRIVLLTLWSIHPATKVSIAAAALSLLSALVILVLSNVEHTRSVRPSTLICVYLIFTIIFDATQLRTLYLRGEEDAISIVASVALGTEIALLCLEAINKRSWLRRPFKNLSPEETSGIINRSLFWWLSPLFSAGFRRLLSLDDLYAVDDELVSERLQIQMETSWQKYGSNGRWAFVITLLHYLRWPLMFTVLPRLCLIGFTFCQPFLITRAINWVSSPDNHTDPNDGYGLIAATGLVYLGLSLSNVHYQHRLYRMITIFRGGMVSQIYAKTLTLPAGVYDELQAVTLMSTDVDRVAVSLQSVAEVWARVVELSIGLWLLERQVGWICIGPVITVAGSVYGAFQLAKRIGPAQKSWVGAVQRRVALTSSMLSSMKSVKMMGLSAFLSNIVQAQRTRELDHGASFRKIGITRNVVSMIPVTVGPFLVFLIFTIQSVAQHSSRLTTTQTFTSLAIIALLTNPARELLTSYTSLVAGMGCLDRLQAFLSSQSVKDSTPSGHDSTSTNDYQDQHGIEMDSRRLDPVEHPIAFHQANIRPTPESKDVLNGINFQVPRGSLTFIIGPVGSGKSTLLKAILGEAHCSYGSVRTTYNDASYCAQTPWIQNTVVRKAICGVNPDLDIDEDWFETVVRACALDEDISQLPHGDDTLLGSRGVTLSGGQKQRLALARAVYARRSTVLLDDVLSALDAKTESLVAERLFGAKGLFRRLGSTVVLVTHAVRHLRLADQIVALDASGKVAHLGSWESIRGQSDIPQGIVDNQRATGLQEDKKKLLPKALRGPTANDIADLSRRTGDVAVYKFYAKSFGRDLLLALLISVGFATITNYFPQIWLEIYTAGTVRSEAVFCVVYAIVAAANLCMFYTSMWIVFIRLIPKSGSNLHKTLLDTVMRAPQSYFDKTDSGTILNLFSQDMTLVDTPLPVAMIIALQALSNLLAQAALIAVGSSYMAISIPGLLVILYSLQNLYLKTSRQLRFLDLEAKSPLYTHFMETLEGLETIRAFGWQRESNAISNDLLDNSQRPYYLLYCIQRWLNLVLQLLIGAMAVILMALAVNLRRTTTGGKLGVALNGILGFNENLEMLFMFWTSLETSLGAIARIRNTSRQTPAETEGDIAVPASWPDKGEVVFSRVCASYGPDIPALKNVSFTITPGENVGVCGRTGSGKSSLLSTLLRLLDIESGNILIDGYDTLTLPRDTVRSRIITIPQEPFFLNASVRENADPTQTATDKIIISVLTETRLWNIIEERGGLDADMSKITLSKGQQQLFCLARAILKKDDSRILVLDEATSSMDDGTDRLMQELLRSEFKDHTVITVAHRLDTILDSDKIAVLDQGSLAEFDSPQRLLSQSSSMFSALHRRH